MVGKICPRGRGGAYFADPWLKLLQLNFLWLSTSAILNWYASMRVAGTYGGGKRWLIQNIFIVEEDTKFGGLKN